MWDVRMFLDGRSVELDTEIAADLCIIGGGPAGLTLAMELESTGLKIVLLESGGEAVDAETQSLYRGTNIGLEYGTLEEARSRFLGGSSNCWGGWCRPLDAFDFERRDWVPDSGWPFPRDELEPFYRRAHDYLKLGPFDYSEPAWTSELNRRRLKTFPLANSTFSNHLVQFSPPVRFGKMYRSRLSESKTIIVCTMSNATELICSGAQVARVHVRTLTDNRFHVAARCTVLAAGGIENARLLLHSNRHNGPGLGNGHDLVGRYFMDHPRFRSSTIRLRDMKVHRLLYDSSLAKTRHWSGVNPNKIAAHLSPTPDVQRQRRLPNSRSYIVGRYAFDSTESFRVLKALRRHLLGRKRFGGTRLGALWKEVQSTAITLPLGLLGVLDTVVNPPIASRRFTLETVIEPIPNRDSRVFLSGDRDRLGMFRAVLDWRLTERDHINMAETAGLLGRELVTRGIATKVDDRTDAPVWDGNMTGCWHHMGTTRMHRDAKQGVVDETLKVHEVANLYCVGSSVFPTAGNDCPTITLVALSIRLADWFRKGEPSSLAVA